MTLSVHTPALHKEYIKAKKLTNGPNLITQSESPAQELIVLGKLLTSLSFNSWLIGETRTSVTPENPFQERKEI